MARKIASLAVLVSLFAALASSHGQDARPPAQSREAKAIAVLKSNASPEDKTNACLELSRIGTKEAVAPLAALLGDETMAHMARYALEPIPDAAVDAALRDALGRLQGRPLVGVIGSIGVRRDTQAVGPLGALLKNSDAAVAQAAARALGSVGTPEAAKELQTALGDPAAGNRADVQAAIAEGLFRCAESLSARDRRDDAVAIYQMLGGPKLPQPVRDAAVRKTRFLRQEEGPRL